MQFIFEINKFDNYRKLSKIIYFDFDNDNICHKLVLVFLQLVRYQVFIWEITHFHDCENLKSSKSFSGNCNLTSNVGKIWLTPRADTKMYIMLQK